MTEIFLFLAVNILLPSIASSIWVDESLHPDGKRAALTTLPARLVGDLDFCRAAVCQQMSQKIRTRVHEPRHQWGRYWPPHAIGCARLCCTCVFPEVWRSPTFAISSTVSVVVRSIYVALFT